MFRALFYRQNGNPASVLSALSFKPLTKPSPGTLNLRVLLTPINPADLNAIEGVYPAKHQLDTSLTSGEGVYVPGNEAVAQVTEVGQGVQEFNVGDYVIMAKPQLGTWMSQKNVGHQDVLKVTSPTQAVSDVHLATISVNPSTAWNMLHDYVSLQPGDWVIQNGANSAVGQALIQIAAAKGINTINLVRNRENLSELKHHLEGLGATKVATYDDLKDLKSQVPEWTQGKPLKLALNCVGGRETDLMTRLLSANGHLVSYGAMSKQPISLPTSLFIFKNLTAHGFWQHQWNLSKGKQEKKQLIDQLINLMQQGKLRAPDHQLVSISPNESDDQVTDKVTSALKSLAEGRLGKKLLLKFET